MQKIIVFDFSGWPQEMKPETNACTLRMGTGQGLPRINGIRVADGVCGVNATIRF